MTPGSRSSGRFSARPPMIRPADPEVHQREREPHDGGQKARTRGHRRPLQRRATHESQRTGVLAGPSGAPSRARSSSLPPLRMRRRRALCRRSTRRPRRSPEPTDPCRNHPSSRLADEPEQDHGCRTQLEGQRTSLTRSRPSLGFLSECLLTRFHPPLATVSDPYVSPGAA